MSSFDSIFVIGGTGNYQNVIFPCIQWYKIRQNDESSVSSLSSCYPRELFIIFTVPHSCRIMHMTCCCFSLSILEIWKKIISVNSGENNCRHDTMDLGCCCHAGYSSEMYIAKYSEISFVYDMNLGSLNVFKYAQGPRESFSHSLNAYAIYVFEKSKLKRMQPTRNQITVSMSLVRLRLKQSSFNINRYRYHIRFT